MDKTQTNASAAGANDKEAIFLVSVAHASSHFYHLVIPSLFPWLMPAFGMGFVEAGFLMTVFFVASALGQAASGFLIDKVGPKTGLFVGLAALAFSSFILGSAVSYWMLMVSALLAGLGNSVFHPADYSLINYNISQKNLGHAFAWHNVTGNIGWAICPLFMVTLAGAFGWRFAAYSASSMAFIVLALEYLRRGVFAFDQTNDREIKEGGIKDSSFGFLRSPAVWLCFLFFMTTSMAFSVLQSYSPAIFKAAYGLDLTAASSALTAYLIAAGAGALAGGFLTNQKVLSADKLVGCTLAFSAVCAVVLASQCFGAFWVIPLMASMGFGVGLASPSRDIMIRRATISKLGKRTLGRVYGFVYCGMDVGQSVAPLIFGPFLDSGMFTAALLGVAVCQTLAIFTALGVGGTERKDAV